jgi:hypothetical protein
MNVAVNIHLLYQLKSSVQNQLTLTCNTFYLLPFCVSSFSLLRPSSQSVFVPLIPKKIFNIMANAIKLPYCQCYALGQG